MARARLRGFKLARMGLRADVLKGGGVQLVVDAAPEGSVAVRRSAMMCGRYETESSMKSRTRPMLGFKTFRCARILLAGIELMHMIVKGQLKFARGVHLSAADQFYNLAI